MTSSSALLRLDNILVCRGMLPIFRDLSLYLRKGQIIRIHGANGSGKSTLLRVCAGLKNIEHGHIYRAASPNWLGQNNALKPALTVFENLSLLPSSNTKNIKDILSRLELASLANHLVASLSSGQKRRCAFARMLVQDSPLWLLDEAEAGLDAASVKRLENEIISHTEKGGGVLMATHLQKENPAENERIFWLESREAR